MTRNLLLGAACILLLIWQMQVSPASYSLLSETVHDAAHIPWFALLTILLTWLCHRLWPARPLPKLIPALLFLVVGTELLQALLSNRIVSLEDALRNGLGALLGLGGVALFRQRSWIALGLLVSAGVLVSSWTPLAIVRAKAIRQAEFPVLFNAAEGSGLRLLRGNVAFEPVEKAFGRALSVPVVDVPWPGVRFRELDRDWRAYETLVVDLVLEASAPIRITAGVRHLGEPPGGATMSVERWVAPGPAQIRFPRNALSPGRAGQSVVTEMMLYSLPEYAGAHWLLRRVTLE